MPRTCQHQITTHGHEMKAKNQMKTHLRKHIEDLVAVKLEGDYRKYNFPCNSYMSKE